MWQWVMLDPKDRFRRAIAEPRRVEVGDDDTKDPA
jgi:hypothetical protein